MSKAVLISTRPEWCEKIMTGQNTIKRLRPGDTVWLSKMFYTRPKKPVPVTVDAMTDAAPPAVHLWTAAKRQNISFARIARNG